MLSELTSMLGIVQNLTILLFMLWVGNKAAKPFKNIVPYFVYAIISVIIGIITYFVGIIISTNLLPSLPFGISDFVGAFIAAGVIYIILWLILSKKDLKSVFVSREEFERLKKQVLLFGEKLASIRKSISLKKLTDEQLKSKLKEILIKEGLDKYNIVSTYKDDDEYVVIVSNKIKAYELHISIFSGDLLGMERTYITLTQKIYGLGKSLKQNKKRILGLFLAITFTIFMFHLNYKYATDKISSLLGIYNSETICHNVLSAFPEIISFNLPNEVKDINITIVKNLLNTTETQILASKLISNQIYVLATSDLKVCSIKYPKEVCECIDLGKIINGII